MSQSFQGVMNDISSELRSVYGADGVAVVPGGGTYGMEAVARQFANDAKCLVIRNGFFSFRWSQILDMGKIAASTTVLKSQPTDSGPQSAIFSARDWRRCGTDTRRETQCRLCASRRNFCGHDAARRLHQ